MIHCTKKWRWDLLIKWSNKGKALLYWGDIYEVQLEIRKYKNGCGGNASIMHTSLQRQQEIKIDILNKEISNKAWLIYSNGHWIWTGVTKKRKDKELTWLFWNKFNVLDFSTLFFFFPTCHALKAWFELSRVKLYWNDLKGNKNYFELRFVGLRYRGFDLLRVKLQWMYEGDPREIDFGLS